MRSWYTVGASGWGDTYQEKVAAHELGHMIGLWDEYAGGAVDPLTALINMGGLMHMARHWITTKAVGSIRQPAIRI